MNNWKTRANTNFDIALALILNRWRNRKLFDKAVGLLSPHEVSKSQADRMRALFKKHGFALYIWRQQTDIAVAITRGFHNSHLDGRPVEVDELPWEISKYEKKVAACDMVHLKIEEMPPIRPKSNPFDFDLFSSGTPLPGGWTAMHLGRDTLERLYLVNSNTGQRFSVDIAALQTAKTIAA